MKAVIHKGNGKEGLSYADFQERSPKAGEVLVKLKTAGLNHRDLFVLERHKPNEPALVIGSDGAGIIEAAGEGVKGLSAGQEVIINPSLGWEKNSDAPPAGHEIVGLPGHGTFAEYIIIPAENAEPKPEYLTWEEAGVFGLAGLTAYRALFTRGNAKPGMKVLIPGIGGGVALFLLKFAKAIGASVYVASRSEEKRQAALELGADKAIDSDGDWIEELGVKVDLVIESVGAATFEKSLKQLRKGGTIVTFGSSTGDVIQLNLRDFFYGQYNMLGSTLGSSEEFREMIGFAKKHKITPVIDGFHPLSGYKDAFSRLEHARQLGKIGFYCGTD